MPPGFHLLYLPSHVEYIRPWRSGQLGVGDLHQGQGLTIPRDCCGAQHSELDLLCRAMAHWPCSQGGILSYDTRVSWKSLFKGDRRNPLKRCSTELGTSECSGNAGFVLLCGFKVKCMLKKKKVNTILVSLSSCRPNKLLRYKNAKMSKRKSGYNNQNSCSICFAKNWVPVVVSQNRWLCFKRVFLHAAAVLFT